ncbi:MAG: hypothetical protein IPG94_22630 [Kineosporiaceae bacterium]|nr:hypothetical protein [Kineosporiaceae bacterium]
MTVRLRCISPMGSRDLSQIPAVARIVEVGEEIDVPDDVAGAPAGTYRALTAAEHAAFDARLLGGLRTRGGDIGPDGEGRPLEVRDPGSGLLAQPEHWQVVELEPEPSPVPEPEPTKAAAKTTRK